jgi:hypothetical protein
MEDPHVQEQRIVACGTATRMSALFEPYGGTLLRERRSTDQNDIGDTKRRIQTVSHHTLTMVQEGQGIVHIANDMNNPLDSPKFD